MYELNFGIYEVVTSVKYELLLNHKYTNNTLYRPKLLLFDQTVVQYTVVE